MSDEVEVRDGEVEVGDDEVKKKKSFYQWFIHDVQPKVYGFGATIVLVGTMFKLLNLNGGAIMLGVGLTTEALIFFISAFEPPAKTFDWSRVFPELDENYTGPKSNGLVSNGGSKDSLSELLCGAGVSEDVIRKLGIGLSRLSEISSQLVVLGGSVVNIDKFSESLSRLNDALNRLESCVGNVVDNINSVSDRSKSLDLKMGEFGENISSLNSVFGGIRRALNNKE